MGIALFVTAFIMFAGKVGWMPGGGDAIGPTGGKLIAGNVGNFILGALMTAGIGLYAPCMALVYILWHESYAGLNHDGFLRILDAGCFC